MEESFFGLVYFPQYQKDYPTFDCRANIEIISVPASTKIKFDTDGNDFILLGLPNVKIKSPNGVFDLEDKTIENNQFVLNGEVTIENETNRIKTVRLVEITKTAKVIK